MSFAEIIGVASIIPFMSLVGDVNQIEENATINAFYTLRLFRKYYLLNTSFKAFAGKNLTFCDAAI